MVAAAAASLRRHVSLPDGRADIIAGLIEKQTLLRDEISMLKDVIVTVDVTAGRLSH